MTETNETPERLTVEEAAVILGATPAYVREAMKQNQLPIGIACRMPGGRWSFKIYKKKLWRYLEYGDEN